jgi:hypothetical protein
LGGIIKNLIALRSFKTAEVFYGVRGVALATVNTAKGEERLSKLAKNSTSGWCYNLIRATLNVENIL